MFHQLLHHFRLSVISLIAIGYSSVFGQSPEFKSLDVGNKDFVQILTKQQTGQYKNPIIILEGISSPMGRITQPIKAVDLGFGWFVSGSENENLISKAGSAQALIFEESDFAYHHTTNSSNILGNVTLLDHPYLNKNPEAKILLTRRNPGHEGLGEVGVFYDSNEQKWEIFNMSESAMPEGLEFNIVIISHPNFRGLENYKTSVNEMELTNKNRNKGFKLSKESDHTIVFKTHKCHDMIYRTGYSSAFSYDGFKLSAPASPNSSVVFLRMHEDSKAPIVLENVRQPAVSQRPLGSQGQGVIDVKEIHNMAYPEYFISGRGKAHAVLNPIAPNAYWVFKPGDAGKHSFYIINIPGGNLDPWLRVVIGAKGSNMSQWIFEPAGDITKSEGFVRIKNARSGNYLHMQYGKLEVGTIEEEWESAVWKINSRSWDDSKTYCIDHAHPSQVKEHYVSRFAPAPPPDNTIDVTDEVGMAMFNFLTGELDKVAAKNKQRQIEKAEERAGVKRMTDEEIAQRKKEYEERQAKRNDAGRNQIKFYEGKSSPANNSFLTKPCSGQNRKIEFSWEETEQAESYLLSAEMVYKKGNEYVSEKWLEKTLKKSNYNHQLRYSSKLDQAVSIKYYVQAKYKDELFPKTPWSKTIKLGKCIESTSITNPIANTNAALENNYKGNSIWNFEWKSIDKCQTYEIEIYAEKQGKKIQVLVPTVVTQSREDDYLKKALTFSYKTVGAKPIPDHHKTQPSRNDKWFVRVRGKRGGIAGPWSKPVRFQVAKSVNPNLVRLPNKSMPISNINAKTETETVVIRHRALCLARYVISYQVYQNNTWKTETKLIKYDRSANASELPNHVVKIPASAINIEIVMNKMRIDGSLGVEFYRIKLPRATNTMHYDVLAAVPGSTMPVVFRTDPPEFPKLVKKGEEEIEKVANMIGAIFENLGASLTSQSKQQEFVNLIEDEQFKATDLTKFISTTMGQAIKDATSNINYEIRSLSLSACGGATAIIGGNVEAGIAFPMGNAITGTLEDLNNIVFYLSPSWSTGFSIGYDAGISLSLWTKDPRNLGGDARGVVFSSAALQKKVKYKDKLGNKKSFDTGITITTWFDHKNNNEFLGFTLTASAGKNASFGKQFVRATTLIPAEM